MSIPKTVYVQAASKVGLNRKITAGDSIIATEYGIHGGTMHQLTALPPGTVVKLYTKKIDGNPYATKYGVWTGKEVS